MKKAGLLAPLLACCLCSATAVSAQWVRDDSGIPIQGKPRPESLVIEERGNLWLVEGQCTEVDRTSRSPYSIVTITHNFTGPSESLGKRFIATGMFSTGPQLLPLMPLGSNGLFVVKWDDRTQQFRDGFVGYYGDIFPAFEKLTQDNMGRTFPPYAKARQLAQDIERVALARHEEQLPLLKVYCQSSVPFRSAWSISDLGESGLEEVPSFLLGLVDNAKVPVLAQVTLDETLEQLDTDGKVKWQGTPARLQFLQRLVTTPADEGGARAIVYRLESLVVHGEVERSKAQRKNQPYIAFIERAQLLEWLHMTSTNTEWPQSSRDLASTVYKQLLTQFPTQN